MSKRKKYRALIIGAGQIASDYDNPTDKNILTHAHAYIAHSDTELAGFFDINQKKAEEAAKKWSSIAVTDLEVFIKKKEPDIMDSLKKAPHAVA